MKWSSNSQDKDVEAFLARAAFDPAAEETARTVLEDIRQNGNRAVSKYVKKYQGTSLSAAAFRVTPEEISTAREKVDREFRVAVREVHKRVAAFAKAGMRKNWSMSSPRGGSLGEQFAPLDRVGVYVPGGAAPLASSALMTVTLAKIAGVPEIVVATPCDRRRKVDPYMLNALEIAGAGEILKAGGIQGIGLLAYGSKTVAPVQKIVGPGGAYVTAAKRQVYGRVAIDLVAGPSEIAILADAKANPQYAAADLLSQAEHGSGHEKALLVTPSSLLAREVQAALVEQSQTLSRRKAVSVVMSGGMLIVVVNTLDEGMDLCNRFAPEHLELMVAEPRSWLKKVRCAGAVFVGEWSPECTGDYVAGPSHVLPTGGAAAMFSGLTVDDFRKRTSFVAFTRADLQDSLPVIEAFGRIEGMDAHARSARIRFE
ncbi:MAG: histidinol dehydrogenase [Lentisphaerae bacterium]|nr:histidinol dehydrogenase [Lentisphaerota bacterium]